MSTNSTHINHGILFITMFIIDEFKNPLKYSQLKIVFIIYTYTQDAAILK